MSLFKQSAGSPADALVLTVVGMAKTRVMEKATAPVPTTSGVAPMTVPINFTEDIEFLGYDVHLTSFGGKAAPGVHTFPFSVVLPPTLPPSMFVSRHTRLHASLVCLVWSSAFLLKLTAVEKYYAEHAMLSARHVAS